MPSRLPSLVGAREIEASAAALAARVILLWQLTEPALSKFTAYESRVLHFRHDYGIPWPELMVPVVGAFELAAVGAVAIGFLPRLLVLPLFVIMPVAIVTAGPESGNLMVLGSAIAIAVLGTGRLSVLDPSLPQIAATAARCAPLRRNR